MPRQPRVFPKDAPAISRLPRSPGDGGRIYDRDAAVSRSDDTRHLGELVPRASRDPSPRSSPTLEPQPPRLAVERSEKPRGESDTCTTFPRSWLTRILPFSTPGRERPVGEALERCARPSPPPDSTRRWPRSRASARSRPAAPPRLAACPAARARPRHRSPRSEQSARVPPRSARCSTPTRRRTSTASTSTTRRPRTASSKRRTCTTSPWARARTRRTAASATRASRITCPTSRRRASASSTRRRARFACATTPSPRARRASCSAWWKSSAT